MKRPLLLALLATMLFSVAFAAEPNATTEADRVAYRYSIMHTRAEEHRIGMDAALGVQITEEMSAAYHAFTGQYAAMESAMTLAELDTVHQAMVQAANEFRTAARTAAGNNTAQMRAAIHTALKGNETYLQGLEKGVYDKHLEALLAIFDHKVDIAEKRIQEREAKNETMTEPRALLEAIKAMRPELEVKAAAAYDACIGDIILACNKTGHQEYIDYRKAVDDKLVELGQLIAHSSMNQWTQRFQEQLVISEEKMQTSGVDTSLMAGVNAKIAEAKAAVDAGDYKTAVSLMEQARGEYTQNMNSIRTQLKAQTQATVSTKRLELAQQAIDAADNAIGKATQRGADVTEQAAVMEQVRAMYAEAQTACAAADYAACEQKLQDAKNRLAEMPRIRATVQSTVSNTHLTNQVSTSKSTGANGSTGGNSPTGDSQ